MKNFQYIVFYVIAMTPTLKYTEICQKKHSSEAIYSNLTNKRQGIKIRAYVVKVILSTVIIIFVQVGG